MKDLHIRQEPKKFNWTYLAGVGFGGLVLAITAAHLSRISQCDQYLTRGKKNLGYVIVSDRIIKIDRPLYRGKGVWVDENDDLHDIFSCPSAIDEFQTVDYSFLK